MAHEGLMLEKMQRQNRIVENLAQATADGTIGKEGALKIDEEDMGVSIGNEVHYHVQQPAAPAPAATAPVAPAPQAQPAAAAPADKPTSNLTKAGIGAALLAALLAAGLGGAALLRPDAVGVGTDTDTDTSLSVSIPPEDRTP